MRKLILAALLRISLLPMAPPASPRLVLPSMTSVLSPRRAWQPLALLVTDGRLLEIGHVQSESFIGMARMIDFGIHRA